MKKPKSRVGFGLSGLMMEKSAGAEQGETLVLAV